MPDQSDIFAYTYDLGTLEIFEYIPFNAFELSDFKIEFIRASGSLVFENEKPKHPVELY